MIAVTVYRSWSLAKRAPEGMEKPFVLSFPSIDSAFEWLDTENAELAKARQSYRVRFADSRSMMEAKLKDSPVAKYPKGGNF